MTLRAGVVTNTGVPGFSQIGQVSHIFKTQATIFLPIFLFTSMSEKDSKTPFPSNLQSTASLQAGLPSVLLEMPDTVSTAAKAHDSLESFTILFISIL